MSETGYHIGPRRLAALHIVDGMSGPLRGCVHEFGLPIVTVLTKFGISDPRHIREIVKEVWGGARQAGQNSGAINTLDFILAHGPVSSKTLRRVLADNNMLIVSTHPTRAMIEASMAEVSGFNERMTKEEKHRRRLVAALAAAQPVEEK